LLNLAACRGYRLKKEEKGGVLQRRGYILSKMCNKEVYLKGERRGLY
jgi:hypothetical protein